MQRARAITLVCRNSAQGETRRRARLAFLAGTALFVAAVIATLSPARAAETGWLEGFSQRSRMLAATIEQGGSSRLFAFVEIAMPKGWKTYWRNPGDAGGLPPRFDWSKSDNLAKASVLFPAPVRLTDEAGDTIGYKEQVVFPVAIEPKDPSRPVKLALELTFGICKDICVPSEAAHELEIEPGAPGATSAALAALAQVPRPSSERREGDPELKAAAIDGKSANPRLVLDVAFPAGTDGADVFVEAPDGLYVPMLSRASPGQSSGGVERFETQLGNALEPKDLKGKPLTATIVSPTGNVVASFTLE